MSVFVDTKYESICEYQALCTPSMSVFVHNITKYECICAQHHYLAHRELLVRGWCVRHNQYGADDGQRHAKYWA